MTHTSRTASALIVGTALALTGCHRAAAPAVAPDAKPGMVLTDAVLALPAVKGNPGAAYLTLANGGSNDATMAAVSITGAQSASMHQTMGMAMTPLNSVVVKAGQTVKFAPGGLHAMVMGIVPTMEPGGASEITVTFADGDKISAPLKLEAAGAMGGAMDMEMKH